MILVFFTPIQNENSQFLGVPMRALVHFILFFVFVHINLGICKKQWKVSRIHKLAFYIGWGVALFMILLSETIAYFGAYRYAFDIRFISLDFLGALTGVVSFKLLYRSCI